MKKDEGTPTEPKILQTVDFGNTGLFINIYPDFISMHFLPEGQNSRVPGKSKDFGYTFILVLNSLMEWLANNPQWASRPIVGITNYYMHDFRNKVFKEFEKFAGVDGIYNFESDIENPEVLDMSGLTKAEYLEFIGGKEGSQYHYRIDSQKLLSVYDYFEKHPEEKPLLKFYRRLETIPNEILARINPKPLLKN
jgi:hypothetical protein